MLKPTPQKGSYRCCDSMGTGGGTVFLGEGANRQGPALGTRKGTSSHARPVQSLQLLQTRVVLPAARKRGLTGLSCTDRPD